MIDLTGQYQTRYRKDVWNSSACWAAFIYNSQKIFFLREVPQACTIHCTTLRFSAGWNVVEKTSNTQYNLVAHGKWSICAKLWVFTVRFVVLWMWPLEQCVYTAWHGKQFSLEPQLVSRVRTALCAIILDLFQILWYIQIWENTLQA